jgi:hypothetical protein
MNSKFIKVTASVAAMATVTSACQNLSPGENAAVFGTVAGLAVGIPLAAAGVNPNIVIPVTAGAVALAAGGAYIIAKHQATERQRKIAEQRARLYLAQRAEAEKKAAQVAAASSSSKKKQQPQKSRYIAVATEKENFNTGQAAVMIYDTQTSSIVGNNVYDLKSKPKEGSISKFDTYSAEYVGG